MPRIGLALLAAVKFHPVVDDVIAQLGSDLALKFFDLFRPELGDQPGVQIDDVVVMRGIGDAVEARNTHAAIYDALRLVRTC